MSNDGHPLQHFLPLDMDTSYHEHFSYFSLITIKRLAARRRLKLIDVEELTMHGGSLRVHLAHLSSVRPTSTRVAALLAREHRLGLRDFATYASFAEQSAPHQAPAARV